MGCLTPERGDDCCINRSVCQIALSLRTGVGVGVTQNEIPPQL